MAALIHLSLSAFIFTKLVVVNLFILFVGLTYQHFSLAKYGLVIAAITYALVFAYHLLNLN